MFDSIMEAPAPATIVCKKVLRIIRLSFLSYCLRLLYPTFA
jgi:hypothetical protein